MILIEGTYGTARVYNDHVEETAVEQIKQLLNQPMTEGAHVCIMPDVHAGAGCVIGYTAHLSTKVVPSIVGVDIGCGMTALKLQDKSLLADNAAFEIFDAAVAAAVPSGHHVHGAPIQNEFVRTHEEQLQEVCRRTGQEYDYVVRSLGTLGGGNHFLELDRDENGDLWFIVHTGSRNFGLRIALYHQAIAERSDKRVAIKQLKNRYEGTELGERIAALPNKTKGLEWIEGEELAAYLRDMQLAQEYAAANRQLICDALYPLLGRIEQRVESVHNYIDLRSSIIRKGAISAQAGELMVIPLNMRDGTIIAVGKGNAEWNYSAPHGAGRLMSRTEAKNTLSVEMFEKEMEGIYSSCVGTSTIDESPMAYKNAEEILQFIEPTADIVHRMFPVWNFKAKD
jgi:RNA-splicing ligase RtcB